jgi:CRISPR-associated protein Cas1
MEAKQHLLGVLTMDVRMENRLRPMLLALSETTASVAACMEGTRKLIKYPQLE